MLCDLGKLFTFLQPQGTWQLDAAWRWPVSSPLSPPLGSDGFPVHVCLATSSPDPLSSLQMHCITYLNLGVTRPHLSFL